MSTPPGDPRDPRLPEALARELYWAQEASARSSMDTAQLRDALHDFVAMVRGDEKVGVPRAEPNLASPVRWRRRLKVVQFRALRPVSRRYDRLLGDLGELAAGLADRVARLEAEIEHLRGDNGRD